MVRVKSAYDPIHESDGERVLVTRYWPRGCSRTQLAVDEWLKSLAPSANLVDDWNHNMISWDQYRARYTAEMQGRHHVIKRLARKARRTNITLLSFEHKDNPYSHRCILRELIEQESACLRD